MQVQIRAPTRRFVRRFRATDGVSAVFAYVRAAVDGASERPFRLLHSFPPRPLDEGARQTIDEAGLAGAAVTLRWA